MKRFFFLNALVPPKGVGGMLVSPPYSWEDVVELVDASKVHPPEVEVISAIGHPATAELLGVRMSRVEVHPEPGDIALVVRLKKRTTTPSGDVEVSHSDLEFRTILYGTAACDNPHCLMNDPYHPSSLLRLFR